jgi:hypothetical protein
MRPSEATEPLSFGDAAKIACAFSGGPFASTICCSSGTAKIAADTTTASAVIANILFIMYIFSYVPQPGQLSPQPCPPEATAPLSFGSAAKIACAFDGGPFACTDCSSTGIAINPATNVDSKDT